MIHEYTYDIRAFAWNSKTRTFSQDAWNLEWIEEDQSIVTFPSMKEPFYIKNYVTGEQRLFTYVEEKDGGWMFENAEDNITCMIWVDPF